MDRGNDVFRALGWGLRRYAWVVALFVLATTALVFALETQGDETYESKALVGVQDLTLDNIDVIPRYGEAIFNNGVVADEVRTSLGLDPNVSVVPDRVDLVSEQDNVVFGVIGRSTDPDVAEDLANRAASVFATEMNKKNPIGSFGVFSAAEPAQLAPALLGGVSSVVIGFVAAVLAGVGAVLLLLVRRRPVWDASIAQEITGTPVLGRVQLPRGSADAVGVVGIAPLCRRLLVSHASPILLVSPPQGDQQRQKVASAMATVLGRFSRVTVVEGQDLAPTGSIASRDRVTPDPSAATGPGQSELVVIVGPTMDQLTQRSDSAMTVMVVPEGIKSSLLRRYADEYLDGAQGAIVFVSKVRRRARRAAEAPARAGAATNETPQTERDDDDWPFETTPSGEPHSRTALPPR